MDTRITCERCEYWREREDSSPHTFRTGHCTARGFLITSAVDFCKLRQLKVGERRPPRDSE